MIFTLVSPVCHVVSWTFYTSLFSLCERFNRVFAVPVVATQGWNVTDLVCQTSVFKSVRFCPLGGDGTVETLFQARGHDNLCFHSFFGFRTHNKSVYRSAC